MDNLQTLFDKKQYDLIVKLTDESDNPSERLLRLSSLVMLNRVNEALDEIEKHQAMYDTNYPQKVMKLHFELLLQSKAYDEARLALKHYKDLPYISQEVEEYLNGMDQVISDEEHQKSKQLSVDVVCGRLEREEAKELLLEALSYVRVYNLSSIIDSLKVLFKRSDVRSDFRAFALFALMEQDYSKEVEFLTNTGIVKVIPSQLKTPFEDERFVAVMNKIDSLSEHNVTLKETANQLFSSYVFDTFPNDIYVDGIDELAKAIISIAKEYIREEVNETDQKVIALKSKIKTVIE